MQRYISQLIEDLENAAKNPPAPVYIEPPPHLDELPDVAELALVPFKPISFWAGIDAIHFPETIALSYEQTEMVNKAIFKLFDSLNIDLIDMPEKIPSDWLYEVLSTNWDEPIQFLPSSGYDLELCTNDPITCPYGEYCDCDDKPDFLLDDDMPSIRNENDDNDELPF